jgi:VanZ family protein
LFWTYAVTWTVLLLVPGRFLFLPISPPSDIDFSTVPIDKIAHAGGYFVFMLLAGAAFNSEPAGIALAWLVSASAAHGAITELLQLAIPSREGDWADVVTDVSGVGFGSLAWWLLRRFVSNPSRSARRVRS